MPIPNCELVFSCKTSNNSLQECNVCLNAGNLNYDIVLCLVPLPCLYYTIMSQKASDIDCVAVRYRLCCLLNGNMLDT